jgi:hypothetical protein
MKSILMNCLLTASPFAMRGKQSPKNESGSPEVAPKSPVRVCWSLLPLLDELITYCYEHQIEEIPALLAV